MKSILWQRIWDGKYLQPFPDLQKKTLPLQRNTAVAKCRNERRLNIMSCSVCQLICLLSQCFFSIKNRRWRRNAVNYHKITLYMENYTPRAVLDVVTLGVGVVLLDVGGKRLWQHIGHKRRGRLSPSPSRGHTAPRVRGGSPRWCGRQSHPDTAWPTTGGWRVVPS